MSRPFIITGDTVVVNLAGHSYTVHQSQPNFEKVRKLVQDASSKDDDILKLVCKEKAIELSGDIDITVKNGEVYYQGEILHNAVSRRLLQMLEDGLDIKPISRFLNNLMQNPSKHSVDETYEFMQHNNLPITPDGCFLGYKYVNHDYTDCHTGKVKNNVGAHIFCKRNTVNDDWRVACSSGYHIGSHGYAFGPSDRRRVVCKINPKDVVAADRGQQKVRVCDYWVVHELKDISEKLPDHFFNDAPMMRIHKKAAKVRNKAANPSKPKTYKGSGNSKDALSSRATTQKRDKFGHFIKSGKSKRKR